MNKKEKIYKEEKYNNNVIYPGDLSGLPDVFSNILVFIDNPYLIRIKKHLFDKKLKYNLKNFVEYLAKKNKLVVDKIFLYDAPPFQGEYDSEENKRKKLYDKFIARFKKEVIIVKEGRTQRLKVDNVFIYHQKAVDVNLGIDLASVPFEFNHIKTIVLISGDSDFVPVVEKLKKQEIKTILWTYFNRDRKSPFSKSNELIKSVDKYVKLTKEDFEEARE